MPINDRLRRFVCDVYATYGAAEFSARDCDNGLLAVAEANGFLSIIRREHGRVTVARLTDAGATLATSSH